MDPRIQYARTADRLDIAYWSSGRGHPLIDVHHAPWNNISLDWQAIPFHRRLAETHRLIRFDNRGSGQSSHLYREPTFDELLSDLETVADHLSLDRFAMYGEGGGGQLALAYAAKHQGRVSCLILNAAFTRGEEFFDLPRVRSMDALLDVGDWETYTKMIAYEVFGWTAGAPAASYARYLQSCCEIAQARLILACERRVDVLGVLGGVDTPTLLLQPASALFPTIEMARALTARIAGSELRLIESGTLWSTELEDQVVDAIAEFVRRATPTLDDLSGLSPREMEVLKLIALGASNSVIASKLSISPNTVLRHVSNVYRKTGTRNRVEAATYAARAGVRTSHDAQP